MKRYSIVTIIAIIAMFTSCKPENDDYYINQVNDNQPTSIMEYFDFYKTQCDAEFMMQSTKSTYSEPSFSAMASIKGNQFPKGLCVDGQNALRSQDYYYSKSADKSFSNFHNNDFIIDPKNLYGRQFQISNLVNDVSLKSLHELGDTTICFPQLISVHFENLQDGKVVAGSRIVWNNDANNENGIVIAVEYVPSSQSDSEIASENPNHLIFGTTVADNGSYTVTSSDLSYFPTGAYVHIYVGRAACETVVGPNNYLYKISAYTLFVDGLIING